MDMITLRAAHSPCKKRSPIGSVASYRYVFYVHENRSSSCVAHTHHLLDPRHHEVLGRVVGVILARDLKDGRNDLVIIVKQVPDVIGDLREAIHQSGDEEGQGAQKKTVAMNKGHIRVG